MISNVGEPPHGPFSKNSPSSSRGPMVIMAGAHLNEQHRQDSVMRDSGPTLGGHLPKSGPDPALVKPTRVDETGVFKVPIFRGISQQSAQSAGSQDPQTDGEDDDPEESEVESVTSDTNRPSKKKKGQRFFCTDFPPCALSFTRSEHLARHIRKHTGERPFQCHCLRRFSRLDNLRQHAQTVHLNEDIPGDSLAATGTRFQRQIRTDRVRPQHRSRTSTMTSQGSHVRGHSRNLSGSSIGSIAAEMPTQEEFRRRGPMPLAMAQNHTPRIPLTLDTLSVTTQTPHHDPQYYNYASGFTTPTSVFSGTSPAASSVHSPMFAFPRTSSSQYSSSGRPLSIPSSANSFQSPGLDRPNTIAYMAPPPPASAPTYAESGPMNNPADCAYHVARAEAAAAEADMRRRTWHPGYNARPATSGLANYQTPDAPEHVLAAQPAATQAIRLPGIDSFDRVYASGPPRRPPSSIESEQTSRLKHPREVAAAASDTSSRRDSWDSMSHNLTQLNIAQATPPRERVVPRSIIYNTPPPIMGRTVARAPNAQAVAQQAQAGQSAHHSGSNESDDQLANTPTTPRRAKRQAWYNGPVNAAQDTQVASPQSRRSPGPGSPMGLPTSSTHRGEYQSLMMHGPGPGHLETRPFAMGPPDPRMAHSTRGGQQHQPSLQPRAPHNSRASAAVGNNTDRLDALVAVATSGEQMNARPHHRKT